ncbi:MAG: hypothetical protein H7Y20_10785 [Bryobacteraceae bacterium]|nr:hypothetical protein [Bryobacteraceae bacterium]
MLRKTVRSAFVVQINGLQKSEASLAGRVEHISTGQVLEFTSEQKLIEFMRAALDRESDPEAMRPE